MSEYAKPLLARLGRAYRAAANPERAAAMSAYMRDQFPFFGIMRKERDDIHREALLDLPKPTEADLAEVARACWGKKEREWQYFAQGLLRKHQRVLSAGFLPVAKELVTRKSWWDTVDELAQHIVSGLVMRNPELATEMDAWAKSDDLWYAARSSTRTAIARKPMRSACSATAPRTWPTKTSSCARRSAGRSGSTQ